MPTPKPKLVRVPVPESLRLRVEALHIECESDQRMVLKYLAPGAATFQSSLDYLETLAHPDRMGRKFVKPPH